MILAGDLINSDALLQKNKESVEPTKIYQSQSR